MTKPPSKQVDSIGFHPKRFWTKAAAAKSESGFVIQLDGRNSKTPQGNTLVLPGLALAQSVASEWEAVVDFVNYEDMPLTRLAFAAIDRMPVQRTEIVAEALRYAETDLLCYPSEYPQALIEREDAAWQPLLAWANETLGLEFVQNRSLTHRPQPPAMVSALTGLVTAMTPYEQAGLMSAIGLTGSVVLALALWRGRIGGAEAFAVSRLGEDFQTETWGRDDEAALRAETMKKQAQALAIWFSALHSSP